MKRRTLIIAVFALAATGGYFFINNGNKNANTPSPVGTESKLVIVRLASSKNLWAALPILANQQGYFKQNGLDVETSYVQAAKFAMDALVGGSADFATVVETNVAYLGFTGNKDVNVIATICQSADSAVVARKSSGINQPTDLKGKKLGILPGTTSQIYAERLLEKNGLRLADVQVVNLQAPAMQPSFIEKGVDAVSIWQPFAANIAKAGGDDTAVFRDPQAYEALMNIATKKEWATANKNTVVAFLKSLQMAADFMRSKPQEAQAVLAKELNLDAALVALIWEQYQCNVSLDATKLNHAFATEGEWIKRSQQGFADKQVPDYAGANYINGSFVTELK